MKAVISAEHFLSALVVQWWTPVFVGIFIAILVYALWPKNRETFDQAAQLPLRED